ncbi:RYamide receptor-like [Penaeus monodon]|uniref:RYamide receptor-like n=1 Tax=Penaeus monodon TaxID=6687 RepID=UPI0018A6F76B|nr:RYamide receptor-like [Penaeus monodon]
MATNHTFESLHPVYANDSANASTFLVHESSVRCYLINLAVSDITMATFCIPFSYTSFMFHRWIFAPEFCRIVAFMQHVSVTCSVYTLVAIGVDRYKALIHPLNTRWTKSRARLVIGGIWLFSVVISLVPLIVSDSVRYDWDGEWYYECKENWPKTQDELYEKPTRRLTPSRS